MRRLKRNFRYRVISSKHVTYHNEIKIDFLYLDNIVCSRCKSTEYVLDQALTSIIDLLTSMGYHVSVNKVHVQSANTATEYRFLSSPTIRINGLDIMARLEESNCQDCGVLCGTNVNCRDWIYKGTRYTYPPVPLIFEAIMNSIHTNPQKQISGHDYQMPENLVRYFQGIKNTIK